MKNLRVVALVAVALVSSAGCGGSDSPTAPSSSAVTVSSLTLVGSPILTTGLAGYRYTAFAQQSNLTVSDVTTAATWTSSNPQVATFTSAGTVSTLRTGTFTVTAAYGGRTATLAVSVQ